MGGSQSARRLTINNEDSIIQISNDLAERLTQSNQSPTPETALPLRNNVAGNERIQGTPQVHESNVGNSNPMAQAPPQVYGGYTMTAYKMQQQHEAAMRAQDEYWEKRLYNLALTHNKINKVFQDEYNKAVDEISRAQGKKKINLDSVVPPCCADKEKVIKCYQENPREILKCANVVDEFNHCVDQRRANIIAARC